MFNVLAHYSLWSSVITNVTAQETRRVDLKVGISYQDDIEKVEAVLRDIISEHEAVLDDPEPTIRLHEIGESSLNFIIRPWVKTSDYWDTYWELTKAIKLRFDIRGYIDSIPSTRCSRHRAKSLKSYNWPLIGRIRINPAANLCDQVVWGSLSKMTS